MTTGDPKNYCMTLLSYVMDHEDYADDIRKLIENKLLIREVKIERCRSGFLVVLLSVTLLLFLVVTTVLVIKLIHFS